MFEVIPMSKESSQIEQIEFDATTGKMRITFKRGGTYVYDEVEPDLPIQLAGADSIGSFFSRYVKGNYNFTKL